MTDLQGLWHGARRLLPWMIDLRRAIHQEPELGMEEFRTAARMVETLRELDIPCQSGVAGTGVVGLLEGRAPGPCVALRADMDALPLDEANDVPYRSTLPGKMHACGHDAHCAVQLGAARLLAERRHFAGSVKLLFQPAEETVGGALPMINAGVLDNPPVVAIFGLHVTNEIPAGTIGVKYGQMQAASDDVRIGIHGQSVHGAYPHCGVDAIVAASAVVTALQTVVSRNVDPRDSAVLSFGTIAGGTAPNILADRVELHGTLRTLSSSTRQAVLERVRAVAEGVAASLGARAEFLHTPGYAPLVNTDAAVRLVEETAQEMLGEGSLRTIAAPSMGVEDFAYFLEKIPGAFYRLGTGNEARGLTSEGHSVFFDIDESALAVGAALQAAHVLRFFERGGFSKPHSGE